MSRRRRAEKREILPDPKFKDLVLSKFMNNLMFDGKKSVSEKIVYGAFDEIEKRRRLIASDSESEDTENSNDFSV